MTQRIQKHPFLGLFDAPDANTSTDVRSDSTVPLQALYLMNNPFVLEQAQAFARRLLGVSADGRERFRHGIALAYGRAADEAEVERAMRYLQQYQEGLAQAGVRVEQQEREAWSSLARVLLAANEFVYVE